MRVLGQTLQALPSPRDGTTIIVNDASGRLAGTWLLAPFVTLTSGTTSCVPQSDAQHRAVRQVHRSSGAERRDAYGLSGADEPPLTAHFQSGQELELDPSTVAVFDYDVISEMRLVSDAGRRLPPAYDPSRLAGRGRPSRASSLLPCRPIEDCTVALTADWPRGSLHEEFDRPVVNGSGFRGPERMPDGSTFQWTNASRAHLWARLALLTTTFRLVVLFRPPRLRTRLGPPAGQRASSADRVPAATGAEFTARIPATALEADLDDIEISSDTLRPARGWPERLGLAVDLVVADPT